MRKRIVRLSQITILFLAMSVFAISAVNGQEVNLDKMVKCGDLICYQSLDDEKLFYYLPDRPRIATKNGRPQFSFMKYARTEETGKAGINRAPGGGLVHFLVTYGATKGRVKNAEGELQEKYPDSRIEGPIVYRSGSFALITSFKEGNEYVTKTVAVGKAPLMEDQKAAVSMLLTREGAELLWESFQTATPDISLVFDMTFSGVREPYEAKLIADWSRISKNQKISAGVKLAWFGADIEMLFDELRHTGGVKIITKGEHAPMDKIIDSVNNKLLQVIFDPVGSELTAARPQNSYSNLNQAVQLLRNTASNRSSRSSTKYFDEKLHYNPWSVRQTVAMIMDYFIGSAWAVGSEEENAEIERAMRRDIEENSVSNDQVEQQAAERTPEEWRARSEELFHQGMEFAHQTRYQDALNSFNASQHALDQMPSPRPFIANIHRNRGLCLVQLNRLDEAERAFIRTIEGSRADSEARRVALAELEAMGRPYRGDQQDISRESAEETAQTPAQQRRTGSGNGSSISSEQRTQTRADEAPQSASESYNRARRLYDEARGAGFESAATRRALEAYEAYQVTHTPTGQRASEIEGRIRSLRQRLERSGTSGTASSGGSSAPGLAPNPFASDSSASSSGGGSTAVSTSSSSSGSAATSSSARSSSGSGNRATASSGSSSSSSSRSGSQARSGSGGSASSSRSAASSSSSSRRQSDGTSSISLVASYRMKKIKRSGHFEYEMTHYRTENQSFAMAENIGDLYSRWGNDPKVFRAVTIDDPVFKQREILVTLDGQDASTFSQYMNFVTVKMKKRHQNGQVSTDEVVITPDSFSQEGNVFDLSYGFKGDHDRNRWLDYEVEAIWSFHGGLEVRMPPVKKSEPMLALAPPHLYRSVTIEGSGDELTGAKVRHGVINLKSIVNDKEIRLQKTIRNFGANPSEIVDIPVDRNNPDVSADIIWYLRGGKKRSSGTLPVQGEIIYWDEI